MITDNFGFCMYLYCELRTSWIERLILKGYFYHVRGRKEKNQRLKIKNQNDNVKIKMEKKADFKTEFKNRLYDFTLNSFNRSLKSANESKIWFSLIRDSELTEREGVDWFLRELNQAANIFASSILTLKGKR